MESLFCCRTVYDANVLYYGSLLTVPKLMDRYLKFIFIVLSASLIQSVVMMGFYVMMMVPMMLCIFIALEFTLFRKIRAKAVYNRQLQLHGNASVMVLDYFENHFSFTDSSSGGKGTVQYNDIAKIVVSQNYIVLIAKYKTYFILDRNSFLKGDDVSFMGFIMEKCRNAKSSFKKIHKNSRVSV